MINRTLAALAVAALLSACATTATPELQAEVARTVPKCSTKAECDAKWDAAQVWVVQHAGFRLQTTTNVVIQTFGPSTSTGDSTRLAMQVLREQTSDGRWQIRALATCGNPFGCTPEIWPTLLQFNRAIGAVQP